VTAIPSFVYLDVGSRTSPHLKEGEFGIEIEMQYSISTLEADTSGCHQTAIYTDRPERYGNCRAEVVDVTTVPQLDNGRWSYVYCAKPAVLLHALRKFGGTCVFLDSDTFIRPGFKNAVASMIADGALLWDLRRSPPCSEFPDDIAPCPNRASHRTSASFRVYGNSGVIGLEAGWGEPILEDALHLIGEMRARGNRVRTLEQSAIFEAVWLSGQKAIDTKPWIEHYSTNSKKRYMHWQIKKLLKQYGRPLPPLAPCIKLTKPRVKLYQYYWDAKRTLAPAMNRLNVRAPV
jgi:hypothetical protein